MLETPNTAGLSPTQNAQMITVTKLEADTVYYFAVLVSDVDGGTRSSSQVTATTQTADDHVVVSNVDGGTVSVFQVLGGSLAADPVHTSGAYSEPRNLAVPEVDRESFVQAG